MKILNWNVERLKYDIKSVLELIESFSTDIIILTETSSNLQLNENYNSLSTKELPKIHDNIKYKIGENRTTIWTKYKFKESRKTFDDFTSIYTEIETEFGILNIYATIIGVFGGIGNRFKDDLKNQISDFEKFEL